MGVVYDYYRAPDRAAAIEMAFHADGLFAAAEKLPNAEAIDFKGVDPAVGLAKLVGLLTAPSFIDLILGGIPIDHVPDPILITPEDREFHVVELSAFTRDTLANASDASLTEAAPFWANIDEFIRYTWNDADEVRPVMDELVAFARRARNSGQLLYCYMCP